MFPILAVETSGELCSAALMLDEKTWAENNIFKKHVHSEKLVGMIQSLLNSFDIDAKALNHIAVSAGPGSFTGLRIGFSAVKGIAFGAGLPVVAVPTFEALAYKICGFVADGQSFSIANSVNVEELYYASFKKENSTYVFTEELQLIEKNNFDEIIKRGELIFGDFYGAGNQKIGTPSAIDVAKWSYFFGKDLLTFDYDYLEPNYLKKFILKGKQ